MELSVRSAVAGRSRREGAPLFSETIDVCESGGVTVRASGTKIDVHALELRDFHALRAILTWAGLLDEEPVEIACKNCQAPITISPCAALAIGPFVDGELHDPELDTTLDLSTSHQIPKVALGRLKDASELTLSPRTVEEALPLFAALAREELVFTGDIARALGIVTLGDERSPSRIARALAQCSDEAWATVCDLYVAAHYPARLFSIALCPKCGARNDVDAPYEREFPPGVSLVAPPTAEVPRYGGEPLPSFDLFATRARSDARRMFEDEGASDVTLVVEDGVPACDDGGEPLLGAYVPGYAGDMGAPSRSPEITVYFRTFRAIWNEEGPYDWHAELVETIEHELAHHLADLAGGDEVDDAERLEIHEEATRVLGKRAIARDAVRGLGFDMKEFARRTWPIWLIVVIAVVAITLYGGAN